MCIGALSQANTSGAGSVADQRAAGNNCDNEHYKMIGSAEVTEVANEDIVDMLMDSCA